LSFLRQKIKTNIFFLFVFLIVNSFLALHTSFIKDSTNYSVNISSENPKIISLSPYVTENLFNLGYGQSILAVTSYCNRPQKAKTTLKIGGIIDPNIEAILELDPDIVFATKEDQSQEQIKKIRSLGVNVFVLKETLNYEDIKQNFLVISEIIGKKEKGKNDLKNIQSKLNKIKKKNLLMRKKKKIFFVLETRPLITVSRQSYMNDMLSFVNAENVVTETNPRYPFFSKEKMLLLKPDLVVFIATQDKNKWQILIDLGIKTNCIFVDPDIFSRANPYTFLEAVEILDKSL